MARKRGRGRPKGYKVSAATRRKISEGLRLYHRGKSRTRRGYNYASLPPAIDQMPRDAKDRAKRRKKYGRRVPSQLRSHAAKKPVRRTHRKRRG